MSANAVSASICDPERDPPDEARIKAVMNILRSKNGKMSEFWSNLDAKSARSSSTTMYQWCRVVS